MANEPKRFKKGTVLVPIDSGPNPSCADPTCNIEGHLYTYTSKIKAYVEAAVREIITADQTQALTNKTIVITDSDLTLQDVDCGAKTFEFEVNACQPCSLITVKLPTVTGKTIAVTDAETFTGCVIFSGNVTVCGNVTVLGCAINACVTCLCVEDKNITLNKSAGCVCANGAGLTVCNPTACTTDGSIIYNKDIPCGGSFWKAGKVGSESEIITANTVQLICGNKTLTGCNILTCGKITGGCLACNLIEGGTVTTCPACAAGRLRPPEATTSVLNTEITACSEEGGIFYSTDDNTLLYHDGTELVEVGAGGGTSFTLVQCAHGFVVRDTIYHNGTIWTKALADCSATLPTYVVTKEDQCGNRFTANKFGRITDTGHCLTIGQFYFASATCVGAITLCEPTFGYSAPILFVEDTNTWHALVHRPSLIACGIASDSEIGSIVAFGVDLACPPTGYLAANGQSLLRAGTYAELFATIGTSYGFVDATHFCVPDLRGKFMRGLDNAAGNDPGVGGRTASGTCANGATGDNVGSIQGCAICCHAHADTLSVACDTHSHCLNVTGNIANNTATHVTHGSTEFGALCEATTCDTHNHTINGAVTTVTGACTG